MSERGPVTEGNSDTIQILLIEDSPVQAELVREQLAQVEGVVFRVEWVNCLAAGLDYLAAHPVDLALVDLLLPDSQGLETFRAVRRNARLTPIVVLTASDDETLAVEAVREGAQDYLVKGQADGRLLARVIRYAIERKRLDQLKDAFVNMVSHELRTPLAVTREGIELLLDGIPGPVTERQTRVLTVAKQNLERLTRLINDLLDIAKLEAGRMELQQIRVDLGELLRQVVGSFESRAKDRGLSLTLRLPHSSSLPAYVDPDKTTQIFTNLIGNALKFTERGGIELSVTEETADYCCTVADTGAGIAPEHLPAVFSKFRQFGSSNQTKEPGTGLGLAITKELVELHRGTIRVDSRVGHGTRFTVTLPQQGPGGWA